MDTQRLRNLANMHKAIGDNAGWSPTDATYEFIALALEAATLLEQPHSAGVPEIDWSQAPEWANWWAMDADGKQQWWEKEPVLDERFVWWLYDWSKAPYRHERIEYKPDKNGVDWRTLQRQRPGAPGEAQ